MRTIMWIVALVLFLFSCAPYTMVKKGFEDLNARLETIEKRLENVEAESSTTSESLESVKRALNIVRWKLEEMKDVRDTLVDMGYSVSKIEESVSRLEKVFSEMRGLKSTVDTMSSLQKSLKKDLDTFMMLADTRSLKSDITELKMLMKSLGKLIPQTGQTFEMLTHVVAPGETLSKIARMYGVTVKKIMEVNPEIKDPSRIYAYQRIKIPVSVETLMSISRVLEMHLGVTLKWDSLIHMVYTSFGEVHKGYANPGLDLKLEPGIPVLTPVGGRVVFAGHLNAEYGNTVKVEHGEGYISVFGRLEKVNVEEGEMLEAGDVVGYTGTSFPNLHLELWFDGKPLDPLTVFFTDLGEFKVTMYTEWDDGKPFVHPYFKRTSSGRYTRMGETIAADPDLLPPGTIVYIPYFRDWYNKGFFVVQDAGGAVKGKRIDVFVHDVGIAKNFSRFLKVYLVKKGEL